MKFFKLFFLSFMLSNLSTLQAFPPDDFELEKKRVVFGVNGAICDNLGLYNAPIVGAVKKDEKEVNSLLNLTKTHLPECRIIDVLYKKEPSTFAFLPHMEHVFEHLMEQDVLLSFFSATESPLPEDLISTFATTCWGEEKYKQLKAQGQFNVFSEKHLREATEEEDGRDNKKLKIPACLAGYLKKDLKVCLPAGVDTTRKDATRNIILADHHERALALGQHTQFIKLREPFKPFDSYFQQMDEEKMDEGVKFHMNQAYYALGVLQHCLDTVKAGDSANLSEAITKTLFQRPLDDRGLTFNVYPDLTDSDTRAFTLKGLELIRKKAPNARLYGEQ